MRRQSISSASEIPAFNNFNGGAQQAAAPAREDQLLEIIAGAAANIEGLAASGTGLPPDAQQRRLAFLVSEGGGRTPHGYSPHTRQMQVAQMELKAGTVIPGLLLTGINSEQPGMVLGQVSENVFDTATGRFLLIPQGTRILGVYDDRTTYGQARVAIIWNRLIFPDGSSLNISGSPGVDIAGNSGIRGRVNNHYGRLLRAAFFSSVFVAAAELMAPNRNQTDNPSPTEVLAESVGLTIANIGARMAQRALDIPPTITVRPGSRFNVMVTQDVVFMRAWNPAPTRAAAF